MLKAVFLDRDNTLILNDGDLGDPARVDIRPGAGAALRRLRDAGYRLIVVTNQGGVARGKYTERDVDAVNQRIAELIDAEAGAAGMIDRFYYCPYHPEGTVPEYRREHPWRKPQPGMIIQAARDLDLDLASCWMIGDQDRDIAAGKAAGCRTVFLRTDRSESTIARADFAVDDLNSAAETILKNPRGPRLTPPREPVGRPSAPTAPQGDGSRQLPDLEPLRRALLDLSEEIRSERLRRSEFTPLRLSAGIAQLGVMLLVLLGLLQVGNFEMFARWMLGALVLQVFAAALLLFEVRG
jgi:D-glycero-D-manno-heptose 1,7-bisphosphate phosphatase